MTPLGAALVSIAIAYVWAGRRWFREALSQQVVHRPYWAMRPSLRQVLLRWITWPIGVVFHNIYSHPANQAIGWAMFSVVEMILRTLPTAAFCFFAWYAWKRWA